MLKIEVGDAVNFVDPIGRSNKAIVTAVWGANPTPEDYMKFGEWDEADVSKWPALNVVIISKDITKTDSYGRQIERHTSITPKCRQSAPGFYWEFLNL